MSVVTIKAVMEARAPNIIDYSACDARITALIGYAEAQTDSNVFNSLYDQAVALRVLHWLTMDDRGGAGGSIVSEAEGKVSRKYSGLMANLDDLTSTSYGLELIDLQRAHTVPFITRMTSL